MTQYTICWIEKNNFFLVAACCHLWTEKLKNYKMIICVRSGIHVHIEGEITRFSTQSQLFRNSLATLKCFPPRFIWKSIFCVWLNKYTERERRWRKRAKEFCNNLIEKYEKLLLPFQFSSCYVTKKKLLNPIRECECLCIHVTLWTIKINISIRCRKSEVL